MSLKTSCQMLRTKIKMEIRLSIFFFNSRCWSVWLEHISSCFFFINLKVADTGHFLHYWQHGKELSVVSSPCRCVTSENTPTVVLSPCRVANENTPNDVLSCRVARLIPKGWLVIVLRASNYITYYTILFSHFVP